MEALRHQVSQLFNIPADKLILKKNGHQGELKGNSQKLHEIGLIDGDLIRVEIGTPQTKEHVVLKVHMIKFAEAFS
jgi:hypothetical protein